MLQAENKRQSGQAREQRVHRGPSSVADTKIDYDQGSRLCTARAWSAAVGGAARTADGEVSLSDADEHSETRGREGRVCHARAPKKRHNPAKRGKNEGNSPAACFGMSSTGDVERDGWAASVCLCLFPPSTFSPSSRALNP